jgi:outer membrane protein assembly factor BamB
LIQKIFKHEHWKGLVMLRAARSFVGGIAFLLLASVLISCNEQTSVVGGSSGQQAPVAHEISVQRCQAQSLPVTTTKSLSSVTSSTIYFGAISISGSGSSIYASDANTGTMRWCNHISLTGKFACSGRCPPPSKAIVGAVTAFNGFLYTCAGDGPGGYTYAFNGKDGSFRWRYKTGCWPVDMPFGDAAKPIVQNGVVYAGSYSVNSGLYALDAISGKLRWHSSAPVSPGSLENGVLYGYSYNEQENAVYAINAKDGSVLWKYQPPHAVAIGNLPIIVDNVVYFGSLDPDDTFYALDAGTGKLLWSYHTGTIASVSAVVSDDVVYIGSRSQYLYALQAHTGKLLWQYHSVYPIYATPYLVGNVLYISMDGVYALDAHTGKVLWHNPLGTAPDRDFTSPIVKNRTAYVGSNDGRGNSTLYALDAHTGSEFWHVDGITQIRPLDVN